MKNIRFFSENFQYLEVKLSIYLNRHVFVLMLCDGDSCIRSIFHSCVTEPIPCDVRRVR